MTPTEARVTVAASWAGTVVGMPTDSLSTLIDGLLRSIPDFPEQGILFRDLTPVFANGEALKAITDAFVAADFGGFDAVLGVEARGFGLAAAAALTHGVGMVPVRKAGKLPGPVIQESYSLEYGDSKLEIQPETLPVGSRVLLVDDVLATGGTLAASIRLAERAGWIIAGIGVVIELEELNGRDAIEGYPLLALTSYSVA